MKKQPNTTRPPFILFHVRDDGEWSKNPTLNLVAFATIDPGIATIVEDLFRSKTGQMTDNRDMMTRLGKLMENDPNALFSFVLSNDLLLLGRSLINSMKDKEVPNLCYHVVIFEEVRGLYVEGKSLVDQKLGIGEIKKTLDGSTTIVYSYYIHLLHTKKAPPISSYFSVAGQEKLCLATMSEVKKLVLADNYDDVAIIIARTLDRLSDTRCANTFTAYAAEIMIAGGTAIALKAADEPCQHKKMLDQATRCFEVALVYSNQLKIESSVALCYLHLGIIREQLMELCDTSEKEHLRQAVLYNANKALSYYRSTPDSAMCQSLNRMIKKNTPFVYIAPFSRAEKIFSDAKKIFFRFQRNPNSVTIKELIFTQVLLDRLLEELPAESHQMKEYCHFALTKVHYSIAVVTTNFESAMEHLNVAEDHLNSAKLGDTERSTDLLGASLLHMKGKVLLRFKKHKEEAVVALKKAYSIYQQHNNRAGIMAITCLVPGIVNPDSLLSEGPYQAKK